MRRSLHRSNRHHQKALQKLPLGVLCEPDSREPLFICEAHAQDDSLKHTLKAFEQAVDVTIEKMKHQT